MEHSLILDPSKIPNMTDGTLPPNTLFDRVINLKFNTLSGKSFTIRSDYELTQELTSDNKFTGRYSIQRCHLKPQIRLSYKQVTDGTAIGVELRITNFHVFTENSEFNLERFSFAGNAISNIEIAVGYFPQFTRPLNDVAWKENIGGKNVSVIKIQGLVIPYYEKTPPDSIFTINGICSSFSRDDGNLFSDGDIKEVGTKYEIKTGSTERETLENIFFMLVTRRFTKDDNSFGIAQAELMSETEARSKGVRVILPTWCDLGYAPQSTVDKKGNAVKQDKFVCTGGATVGDTLRLIKNNFCPSLVYAQTKKGEIIVWNSDSLKKAVEENAVLDVSDTAQETIIPSVYQINANAGLCNIKCPFFGFLDPFQRLKFLSRYQLTNFTSSLARSVNYVVDFYSINCQIDFATVEQINTVTMSAIGLNYSK